MAEKPDFSEDDQILVRLQNGADIEAFANLMAHAHEQGISAADFVREEPKRTSRKVIRTLCLKNQKRTFKAQIASVIRSLWDRPVEDSEAAYLPDFFGGPAQSPRNGKPERNGKV
ncbi:MAG: hypothetical protein O7G87_12115 [bacterium]|nr:hypothetical protein [bacterium]